MFIAITYGGTIYQTRGIYNARKPHVPKESSFFLLYCITYIHSKLL